MKSEDNSVGLLQDYLGFGMKTLVTFTSLVVGVLVVVTGIYVSIFGFDTWKTNMQRAGSLMVINLEQPVTGGAVPPGANKAPAPRPNDDLLTPGVPQLTPAAAPAARQFACPNCGNTGLPAWTENGRPICPNCGSTMGIAGHVTKPKAGFGL